MASLRRKFKKLQNDPAMFVRDMILKRIGETGSSKSTMNSVQISAKEVEIVDGLTVINNQDLAAKLQRLKDSQHHTSITITWRG